MRKKKPVEKPLVTRDPDGKLTRVGALVEARAKYGDMGTISSDERMPRLVWYIGQFNSTVGKGKTWEEALSRSRPAREEKLHETGNA